MGLHAPISALKQSGTKVTAGRVQTSALPHLHPYLTAGARANSSVFSAEPRLDPNSNW